MKRGLILYGPPAAGKDTITRELNRVCPHLVHFPRIKVGGGRTSGYRLMSEDELDDLVLTGNVVWLNARYGSTYAIDRPALTELLRVAVPIVHLGQPEGVTAVLDGFRDTSWVVVSLWCPRPIARQRIVSRGTNDLDQRLQAWDETPTLAHTDLAIDTSSTSAADAANLIVSHVFHSS